MTGTGRHVVCFYPIYVWDRKLQKKVVKSYRSPCRNVRARVDHTCSDKNCRASIPAGTRHHTTKVPTSRTRYPITYRFCLTCFPVPQQHPLSHVLPKELQYP